MKPSPPASLTAPANRPPAAMAIGALTIGASSPKRSVNRVDIIAGPPALARSGRRVGGRGRPGRASLGYAKRPRSHPEHAKPRVFNGGIQRRPQAQAQYFPALARVDNPVVPQPRRGIQRMALPLEHLDGGALELGLFLRRPFPAFALDGIALDGGQNPRRLLAAHHRNPAARPCPHEPRLIGATGHTIVPGPETAAHYHGHLGYIGGGYRRHHLRAMPGDALVFITPPNHEAGDILQENQG